jgi:transposase
MDQDETIRLLQEENYRLKCENRLLKERIKEIDQLKGYIKELEARLSLYENAHTPPSLRRDQNRKKGRNKGGNGTPGQKFGHKGITRPQAEPDRQVEVTVDRCPGCGTKLGEPFRTDTKIIEEIPEPQPKLVTKYRIAHYRCPCCHREVVGNDSTCPNEGIFGINTIAQATLLKYEDRLPHRKIRDALKRLHNLDISPGTILDLTRRAADAVQSEYKAILERVRDAEILYVDETSIDVQGKNHWIWIFTTPSETFVVIRKSRGMKVLVEVLTRKFKGIIVYDGWKPYAKFTKRLQRCWAHLLRESKDLAEKVEEAVPLHKALKKLYEELNSALESNPPPEVRMDLWQIAREALQKWISKEYVDKKVRKLIGKISNGFEYWFTFVIHPGVEPTNNRAERALREHVVLRKIMGTLRNNKGTSIHERIMTVLATWAQRGLDSLMMLRACLAS